MPKLTYTRTAADGTTHKVGPRQRAVLDTITRYDVYPGRWQYGTHSETVSILDSLVRRGFVSTRPMTYQGQPMTEYRLIKP